MVFLRPVVVRDGSATNALSMDRYDLMRTSQQQSQPVNSSLVPVNESPVLPAITPVPAAAPARPVAPPLFQTAPLPMVNDR